MKRMNIVLILCLFFGAALCFADDNAPSAPAQKQKPVEISVDLTNLTAPQLLSYVERIWGSGIGASIELLDRALAKDPSNERAKLYSVFAQPMRQMKGYLARIQPAMDTYFTPAQKKGYRDQFLKDWGVENEAYFLDGKGDISTEAELQNYFDESFEEWGKVRAFAKSYQGEVTVRGPAQGDIIVLMPENCAAKIDGDTLKLRGCSKDHMNEFTFDNAEGQWLSQAIGSYQYQLMLATAYHMEGMFKVMGFYDFDRAQFQLSWRDVVTLLSPEKDFGALRSERKLKFLREIGEDLFYIISKYRENKDSLCSKQKASMGYQMCTNIGQAPEYYTNYLYNALNTSLNHKPVVYMPTDQAVKIDIFKLSDEPLPNIKGYLPDDFDRCGRGVHVPDITFNGMVEEPRYQHDIMFDMARQQCR